MHPATVLDFVSLFFASLLAGTLFVIDYGVGRAVAAILDEQVQIQVRQTRTGAAIIAFALFLTATPLKLVAH